MLGDSFGHCLAPLSLSPPSAFLSTHNLKVRQPRLIFDCVVTEGGISTAPNTAPGRHTGATQEQFLSFFVLGCSRQLRSCGRPLLESRDCQPPKLPQILFPQYLYPASCPRSIFLILPLPVYSSPLPSPTPNMELGDLV